MIGGKKGDLQMLVMLKRNGYLKSVLIVMSKWAMDEDTFSY